MDTRLRNLRPNANNLTPRTSGASWLFRWGVFVVMLQFFFSPVVMGALGLETFAGGLLMKFHPTTYIVIIVGLVALVRGVVPLSDRLQETPGLMLFIIGIPILGVYSAFWTGVSGTSIFLESYLSAGMLALMLISATAAQKRLLGYILIATCVLNVFVGLYESLTYDNWFPPLVDPDLVVNPEVDDFRANAFYVHPLTASLITTMAIFLLYEMRLRLMVSAPIFALLLLGLLSFGGRTALALTIIMSAMAAGYVLVTGLVKRQLKMEFVVAIAGAVVVIPLMTLFIVTQTTIADRIIHTLYFDDSAAVRNTQWLVLNYLTQKQWLFGISKDELNVILFSIGFDGKVVGIENFWLLMFLQLGAVAFVAFVVVFTGFLIYCALQAGTMMGWLLMIAALLIDSSSNSLGVKSNDLFLEVAFLTAIAGFRDYVPVRSTYRKVTTRQGMRGRGSMAEPAARQRSLRASLQT